MKPTLSVIALVALVSVNAQAGAVDCPKIQQKFVECSTEFFEGADLLPGIKDDETVSIDVKSSLNPQGEVSEYSFETVSKIAATGELVTKTKTEKPYGEPRITIEPDETGLGLEIKATESFSCEQREGKATYVTTSATEMGGMPLFDGKEYSTIEADGSLKSEVHMGDGAGAMFKIAELKCKAQL